MLCYAVLWCAPCCACELNKVHSSAVAVGRLWPCCSGDLAVLQQCGCARWLVGWWYSTHGRLASIRHALSLHSRC